MLEAIRLTGGSKSVRFYQASTSEMYGGMGDNMPKAGYNEKSPFHPRAHMAWPSLWTLDYH